MTHPRDERLQAIAVGEGLAAEEIRHLADCEACRVEVDAYRALGEVLSTLRPAAPPGLTEAVMTRIETRRATMRRQLAVVLGAPAAVLVALGFAAREAILASMLDRASAFADAVGVASRAASVLGPFVSAWGPYLAFAAAALALVAIPVVRRASEVLMRSRAANVATLLLVLAAPAVALAQDAGPARSPRLQGDWPAEDRRVTLELDHASPSEALRKLGEAAGWSVIVPDVRGDTVTLRLTDVPADQALARLLDQWNASARRSGPLVTIVQETAPALPLPPPPVSTAAPALPAGEVSDRAVAGDDVVIEQGERVRNLAVMGGDALVRGDVLENVSVVGGDLRVARTGHVHGNVSVVGGDLDLDDGGRIDGARSAIGSGEAAEAVVGLARPGRHGGGGFLADVFATLARGFAFFVLGLLLSVFAKDRINVVTEEIRKRPVHAFGSGLLGVISLPVLTVLLCIVIIGIPAVPFLWLGAVFATFAGMTSIALIVGERLPLLESRKTQIVCLALGAATFTVLDLVPVVGGIALAVAGLVAFGAVLRTRFAKPNGKPPAVDEFAYRSPA